jgi:Tfp pilus assembly protein PilF
VPGAPRFPDYVFPQVPAAMATSAAAGGHSDAWNLLQTGDLRDAERGFGAVLRRTPAFYPSEAGLGYVELARRRYAEAIARFDQALKQQPAYAPALAGRGDALAGLARDREALASFEAALAADPTLTDVQRRVESLRFRTLEAELAEARRAGAAGRDAEARAAYERAIAGAPESAFLYRELALVEQRQGDLAAAAEHAARAAALDPGDSRTQILLGELHEAKGEFAAAADAYARAHAIDPSPELDARAAAARARAEAAALPEEYRAIGGTPQVARGELAALIGVRLEPLLASARPRNAVVITDARSHWALPWIMVVARAGVLEVYPNHTFQPGASVSRGDLARAASNVVTMLADRDPQRGRAWQAGRPTFADLPREHLSYPAAALAVSAGVMRPLDDGTFQLTRPVSGAEAVEVVGALEALTRVVDRR